jgi:hypothetical protein
LDEGDSTPTLDEGTLLEGVDGEVPTIPFDTGSSFEEGNVDGAPFIVFDEGEEGCPFDFGPPFDEGDSAPPLDDGVLLDGVDGATPLDVEGAEPLLELIIPFGSFPLVDGATTGETTCGGSTPEGVITPGVGVKPCGVGTEGVVGIDAGVGAVGGEIMVGATTGDGAVGGVTMMGVGAVGWVGILNDMLPSSCNNRSNISISSNKFSSLYFLVFVCKVDKR